MLRRVLLVCGFFVGLIGASRAADLELHYVPSQTASLVVLGRGAIEGPIAAAVKMVDAEGKSKLAGPIQAQLLSIFGAPTDAIEQLTFAGVLPLVKLDIRIIRTVRPHDFKKTAAFFPADAKEKRHGDHVYYASTTGRPTFYAFPDDRTAIVTNEEKELQQCLDAGPTGAAPAAWGETWKQCRKESFALLVDAAGFRRAGDVSHRPIAQALGADFLNLWDKATLLTLAGSQTQQLSLALRVTTETAEQAAAVRQSVDKLLPQSREGLGKARQQLATDAIMPEGGKRLAGRVMQLGDDILSNVQVVQEDKVVQIKASAQGEASLLLGASLVLPAISNAQRKGLK